MKTSNLTAAAPELLAALKWALSALDASRPNAEFYEQPRDEIDAQLAYAAEKMATARGAIAKATE